VTARHGGHSIIIAALLYSHHTRAASAGEVPLSNKRALLWGD